MKYRYTFVVFALGVFFSLYLLTFIPDEVFFSGDGGLKTLLVRQFAAGSFHADLRLPARPWVKELWDEGFYPFGPVFVFLISGHRFPVYHFLFPLMTSPFYKFFGFWGLYFIPVLSLWLTWFVLYKLCRFENWSDHWTTLALATLILGSPLTLYGAMYWEHTVAVLFGFAALYFLKTTRGALSGACVALSIIMRPEMYALLAALLVLVLFRDSLRPMRSRFVISAGAVLLLFWIVNQMVYYSPLGVHSFVILRSYTLSARFLSSLLIFKFLLIELLRYFPLILCFLLAFLVSSDRSYLFLVAFLLISVPLLTPNFGGKQWGPRFLLLVFPIAAFEVIRILQMLTLKRRTIGVALFAICLGYGIYLNTFIGPKSLRSDYQSRVYPALQILRKDPGDIVVISQQHIAQEMESLIPSKTFFRTSSESTLTKLAPALKARGYSRVLFVNHQMEPPPQDLNATHFQKLGDFGIYRIFEILL